MIRKEVKINNGLKEWLGENPTWSDIGFIFGGAFLATGLLIDGYSDELRQLPLWRSILFVVVAFDIIGGAIANFSVSTDRYYSQNRKKRWLFFAEHMVHFLLLYLAIGGNIRFWVFIFAYTMVGGIIVDQIRERRIQEMAAPVFVTVGCLLFYGFDLLIPFMEWFPAVFMIKIILGFSVRRAKPTGNLLITTKNKK